MASTRPKLTPRPAPSTPGGPLRNSQTPNISYPFLADSPSHFLAPKDGATKLKVRAGISPEARSSRIGAPMGGLRPVTPRPIKRTIPTSSMQTPGTEVRVKSRMGMVTSGSDDSLKGFMVGGNDVGLDDKEIEEEVLGESEAVLVTVRYVFLYT